MLRRLKLEDLLDTSYPNAEFHDASLHELQLDFATGSAVLRFSLYINLESHPEAQASGELRLGGLCYFAMEPLENIDRPLWIVDDGPLADLDDRFLKQRPTGLPENAFCHYLFSSSTNSYIVFAATDASFTWDEE